MLFLFSAVESLTLSPRLATTRSRTTAPAPRMGAFSGKHTTAAIDEEAMYAPVERDFLDRKGKIVATLGPASSDPEALERLIKSGVDVFRLNSSHRRPGQFEEIIPCIRKLAKDMNRDVKILGDIQGPKFRCSLTENDEPVPLKEGDYTMEHTALVYIMDGRGNFVGSLNLMRPAKDAAAEVARQL